MEDALKIYRSGTDEAYRKADIARALYKLGQTLLAMGHEDDARRRLEEGKALRLEFCPNFSLNSEVENEEAAYETLVSRWSR